MNTPPINAGKAGSFSATAAITNTGGIRAIILILEDPLINAEISSSTDISGVLFCA